MAASSSPTFGERLRRYREMAGLTQTDLAARSGVSAPGISALERGLRTHPRIETVRMLATALNLDTEELSRLIVSNIPEDALEPFREPLLPTPPTLFIGRDPERAQIREVFAGGVRLVTLTGPGGVGKTRIAIEVARQMAPAFPDGVIFVDLTPLSDPLLVLPAIADLLDIPLQPGYDVTDVLATALANKRMMLVLDNLEHVVDAVPQLGWLLATCPRLTIMATSRVVLRVSGEQVIPIDPMPVAVDDAEMIDSDALQLFTARAQAIDASFVSNPTIDIAIVRKLEGLPLAIELAAARVRYVSRETLLEQLDQQLVVLRQGNVDAPLRHRTIRDTIAWSYTLLSPEAQQVMRWLSVFPAGCTFQTAQELFREEGVLTGLEELVDSSLLRRRSGIDGAERYVMLQTVREYGMEHLIAVREEQAARSRVHECWCVPVAQRAERQITQPNAHLGFRSIRADYPNLQAHVHWLIAEGRIDDALQVSGSLASWRLNSGRYQEGRQELELLLTDPRGTADTAVRACALVGLGIIQAHQSDTAASLATLEQAAAAADRIGHRLYRAMALMVQGRSLIVMGELERAEKQIQTALILSEEIGNAFSAANCLGALGQVAMARGEWNRTRSLYQRSLDLCLELENAWSIANAELRMAQVMMHDGDLDGAERLVLSARSRIEHLGDRRDLPETHRLLATVATRRGQISVAESLLTSSLEIARENGDMQSIANAQLELGRLASDRVEALDHFQQAMRWYERCHNQVGVRECQEQIAALYQLEMRTREQLGR